MTERKPAGVPIHTWVDELIVQAQERGAFDNLPGAGKPLPGIDRPLEEDWWIRQKLRDEDLPTDVLLPPALQLRRELADLPERVRHLRTEAEVRAAVAEVNGRVAAWIRRPSGPVLPVAPASLATVLDGWHAARATDDAVARSLTRHDAGTPVAGTPMAATGPAGDPPDDGEPASGGRRRRRGWFVRHRTTR